MKGTPIRFKGDKMKFNRNCNKQNTKSTKKWYGQDRTGSKSNRMNEITYKGMYYQMKKETTCLYSSFIKFMYMVNVHNSSTF